MVGRMATNSDEFSHWMECIKVMTVHDDFSTNPLSHDDYRSYPPGMALFQYIVQRVYLLFNRDKIFSEWIVYFAYQVFSVSLILPFLKKISWKKSYIFAAVIVCCLLSPSMFYDYFFSTVTIDPFVCMLAGSGLAYVILLADNKISASLIIALYCINLCLAKDIGLTYAIILISLYVMKMIVSGNHSPDKRRKKGYVFLLNTLIPVIASVLYKKMWSYEVASSGAPVISPKHLYIKEFFEYFIFHKGTDYRQTVVDNYKSAMISGDIAGIHMLGRHININYLVFTIVIIVLLLIGRYWTLKTISMENDKNLVKIRRFRSVSIIILSAFIILYEMGMGIYFTSTHEYPAVKLQSFERYMNIAFMGVWMFLMIDFIWLASGECGSSPDKFRISLKKGLVPATVALVLLLCVNYTSLKEYLSRAYVANSIISRSKYDTLTQTIMENCDSNDKIYFVSRGDEGTDSGEQGLYLNAIKMNIEPIELTVDKRNQWDGWGLGPPLSESDIWYLDITPEEWYRVLVEENYTYVAVFRTGDDLYDNFGALFEREEDVRDDSLYRIDTSKKCLIRIE